LDALNDDLFKKMTRKPYLQKTLEGIDAAMNAGLTHAGISPSQFFLIRLKNTLST
jgi:molybdenum cofactor biosynthesis enzyme MoaA